MGKIFRKAELGWMIIAIFVPLLGIVLGSFVDLQLAKNLYSSSSFLSPIMTYVGSLPGYVILGGAGLLLGFYLTSLQSKKAKAIGFVSYFALPFLSGALYGYDCLKERFGTAVGLLLGILIVGILDAGLYFLTRKDYRSDFDFKAALVILFSAALTISLTYFLKKTVIRPRYLFVMTPDGEGYYTAWFHSSSLVLEKFPEIEKKLINSFPSGHMAVSSLLFLSFFFAKRNGNVKGKEGFFFLFAGCWAILVAFGRMRGGYHYLSDVSWGAFLNLFFSIFFFIAIFLHAQDTEERHGKNKASSFECPLTRKGFSKKEGEPSRHLWMIRKANSFRKNRKGRNQTILKDKTESNPTEAEND